VLYGGLAVLVMCSTRRSAPRLAAWVLALILTAGVAFSRVYEGEHHVLDAMAGVALGIGALAAAVRVLAPGDLEEAR
jgi:membrane-associated phospholipid phosphatase